MHIVALDPLIALGYIVAVAALVLGVAYGVYRDRRGG